MPPDIRLVDGETPEEGRVEVFLAGQWGQVCFDLLTDTNVNIALCRALNFTYVPLLLLSTCLTACPCQCRSTSSRNQTASISA